MSNKVHREIEHRLSHAFQASAPDCADKIWDMPVEKAKGTEWYLDGLVEKKRKNWSTVWKTASAVAACMLLFLAFHIVTLKRPQASVYLDVNPAVELQVNSKDEVLLACARNQDGEAILGDMDLKGTNLDVAVNAVLGSMLKHGYLNVNHNAVLVSVEGRDLKKADALRRRLVGEIENTLKPILGNTEIYEQSIQEEPELDKMAETYGISPGKAALIRTIKEDQPELEYKNLSQMTVSQLMNLLDEDDLDQNKTDDPIEIENPEEPEKEVEENPEEKPEEKPEKVENPQTLYPDSDVEEEEDKESSPEGEEENENEPEEDASGSEDCMDDEESDSVG